MLLFLCLRHQPVGTEEKYMIIEFPIDRLFGLKKRMDRRNNLTPGEEKEN